MSNWRRKLEHNDLLGVNAGTVAQTAVGAINAVQGQHPREQVLGLAMAFVAIMRRSDVHFGDVLTMAERMLQLDEKQVTEMRAIRAYLNEEVFDLL